MKRRLVFALCTSLCPIAFAVFAQERTIPHAALQAQDVRLLAVPPFSFSSNMCDARGNVYLELSDVYSVKGILRVSENGDNITPIPLPKGLPTHGEWHSFAAPDGDVFYLFAGLDDNTMIHLSSTSEEVSRTTLTLPRYFHVRSFSVLPNGRAMLLGSVPTSETSQNPNEVPVTLWLDASGSVVRRSSGGKEFSPAKDRATGLVAAEGPDSFVQVTDSDIKVFTSRGDLLRSSPLVKPTVDSFASGVEFVDGRLAIMFDHPPKRSATEAGSATKQGSVAKYMGPVEQAWLLTNSITGEPYGFFEQPKNFSGTALCYLGQQTFLYITVQNQHPALVHAVRK